MNTSRNYLLLFVGCIVFHVLGTWNLPLIDRDEPRFAEASREMRERNDWIVPYFNGQYRFDKPPLTYWAQVASYKLIGESDFAARFPSAVAAGLTGLVIFAWGSRISGPKMGLWAAIIFTLSLQTFIHAKAAVADMWLVLFMTMTQWAGWELISDESKRRTPNAERRTSNRGWWWSFYISLALAFLAKGPIGWIPLIPVIWFVVRNRDREVARRFAFGRGLLLTIFIVCVWAVPAIIQTHGEFLRIGIGRHVIGRSLVAMEGHGAKSFGIYLLLLPFYFLAVFVSFFPWSFKLPWLLNTVRKRFDSIDVYLLCAIVSIFAIFTLVATKLPHYTLPAFPLLSLLLARHWLNETPAAAENTASGNSRPLLKILGITTALAWMVLAIVLSPFAAKSFPSYTLFQNSRDWLRPEMEFGSIDYAEPSLVWYFRSRVKGFLTPLRRGNASQFMSEPGPRFVILPASQANVVFPNHPPDWKQFQTTGFNIPKGKKVDLTLLLKPE